MNNHSVHNKLNDGDEFLILPNPFFYNKNTNILRNSNELFILTYEYYINNKYIISTNNDNLSQLLRKHYKSITRFYSFDYNNDEIGITRFGVKIKNLIDLKYSEIIRSFTHGDKINKLHIKIKMMETYNNHPLPNYDKSYFTEELYNFPFLNIDEYLKKIKEINLESLFLNRINNILVANNMDIIYKDSIKNNFNDILNTNEMKQYIRFKKLKEIIK
jgi:hypothetical protein